MSQTDLSHLGPALPAPVAATVDAAAGAVDADVVVVAAGATASPPALPPVHAIDDDDDDAFVPPHPSAPKRAGGAAKAPAATLKKSKTNGSGDSNPPVANPSRECPICFDNWTSKGRHRLCCLACGHMFGEHCIEKWVKMKSKCPQCNAPARQKDIRSLFVTNIVAVDPLRLEQAHALTDKAVREKAGAEARVHRLQSQCAALEQECAFLKQLLESGGMFPSAMHPFGAGGGAGAGNGTRAAAATGVRAGGPFGINCWSIGGTATTGTSAPRHFTPLPSRPVGPSASAPAYNHALHHARPALLGNYLGAQPFAVQSSHQSGPVGSNQRLAAPSHFHREHFPSPFASHPACASASVSASASASASALPSSSCPVPSLALQRSDSVLAFASFVHTPAHPIASSQGAQAGQQLNSAGSHLLWNHREGSGGVRPSTAEHPVTAAGLALPSRADVGASASGAVHYHSAASTAAGFVPFARVSVVCGRVLLPLPLNHSVLVSAQLGPSKSEPVHGYVQVCCTSGVVVNSVRLHSKPIRDMALQPSAGTVNRTQEPMVATASLDSTLKLSRLSSSAAVASYQLSAPAWSCVWHPEDSHLIYCGLQSGSVVMLDIRLPKAVVAVWASPCGPASPVHSLAPVLDAGDCGLAILAGTASNVLLIRARAHLSAPVTLGDTSPYFKTPAGRHQAPHAQSSTSATGPAPVTVMELFSHCVALPGRASVLPLVPQDPAPTAWTDVTPAAVTPAAVTHAAESTDSATADAVPEDSSVGNYPASALPAPRPDADLCVRGVEPQSEVVCASQERLAGDGNVSSSVPVAATHFLPTPSLTPQATPAPALPTAVTDDPVVAAPIPDLVPGLVPPPFAAAGPASTPSPVSEAGPPGALVSTVSAPAAQCQFPGPICSVSTDPSHTVVMLSFRGTGSSATGQHWLRVPVRPSMPNGQVSAHTLPCTAFMACLVEADSDVQHSNSLALPLPPCSAAACSAPEISCSPDGSSPLHPRTDTRSCFPSDDTATAAPASGMVDSAPLQRSDSIAVHCSWPTGRTPAPDSAPAYSGLSTMQPGGAAHVWHSAGGHQCSYVLSRSAVFTVDGGVYCASGDEASRCVCVWACTSGVGGTPDPDSPQAVDCAAASRSPQAASVHHATLGPVPSSLTQRLLPHPDPVVDIKVWSTPSIAPPSTLSGGATFLASLSAGCLHLYKR